MPWPSCKASSPSTILHGSSPKTVTRIGFATPWILISVDPLTSKGAPETPCNAGASASSLWRWARSTSLWKMSSRRRVQEAPVSTNAPMDRPPTCKSTTGRPDTAPTTSVRFPHGFGGTRGTCGQRGRIRSNKVSRQGSKFKLSAQMLAIARQFIKYVHPWRHCDDKANGDGRVIKT